MVCLGNICRSPLAEGILKSKLDWTKFFVDSAGTSSYHIGDLPDPRSITIARLRGIDITDQQARQFKTSDFDKFDIIYAMDKSNFKNICCLARNDDDLAKVKLILEENPNSSISEVPDPYYGGDRGFENVFNLLDETCEIIANSLQEPM